MSSEEFTELGLTKLTPQEINKLSDWINNFDKSNLKQNQAFPDNEDRFVITSQIDGSFRGWDGKTVFRLKNGQISKIKSFYLSYLIIMRQNKLKKNEIFRKRRRYLADIKF